MLFEEAYLLYTISLFLIVPMLLLGIFASWRVNAVFNKYNKVPCSSGMNAQTYAQRFLADSGVEGVQFQYVSGTLTDSYHPKTKIISLSTAVRQSSCVGAIGVACHECGHAVQHDRKFFFSSARLKLVPVVNIANTFLWPIFIFGFAIGLASPYTDVGNVFIIIGLVVMGLSLLFSLVTLPTEFDASRRAYNYLKTCMLPEEAKGVRKVLTAAAMTYVVSFLMTAVQFLRILALALMSSKRKNRD